MKTGLRSPPVDVPTLTEVVGPSELVTPVTEVERVADESVLSEALLAELQGQVDQLLVSRLRERLTPLFEQIASSIVEELTPVLHDAVRQAIVQELARTRSR